MDITTTTAPKSDQQNFDDYITGPRIVTVAAVKKCTSEQPVNIELVEYPGRPYKPNLSMRRVLAKVWGQDTDHYVGRRLKLVGNPKVVFGGREVGGIEIAELSDIDAPVELRLTETRGKKRAFTVSPLVARDWLAELKTAGTDLAAIKKLGTEARAAASPTVDAILTRYNELKELI